LTATFDPDVKLGAATAVRAELRIDPHRPPVTEIRVYYPASIGVLSSGLGLEQCRPPAPDLPAVIFNGPRFGGCSPNAVIAYGTARANVRLSDGAVVPEFAKLAIFSGEVVGGRLGIVAFVTGVHPFIARLAYAGDLRPAPRPFGGALVLRLSAIRSLEDLATVGLVRLQLEIGSRAIVYRTQSGTRYRPEGVLLPDRCPRSGFRFRAEVAFADGGRASAASVVRCPPLPGPSR
jgi:hypothetical protein